MGAVRHTPNRKASQDDVPLHLRLSWTIGEFAAMYGGVSWDYMKKRLVEDDTGWWGEIVLAGGAIRVPAYKDAQSGAWRVPRAQAEAAIAAAKQPA